jgi:hypothetical protein
VTGTPERTAVYRIRGEGDELIYIGMTNSIPIRWNGHERVQPWWDEIRSLTVDWYESREEAAEVEKAAIPAEQPKYNVTYLKPARTGAPKRNGPVPVDWESFPYEPWDDDDDLINLEDVARTLRTFESPARAALRNTGGPRGFRLATQHLFRKGEIRRWIDAVEASQNGAEQSGDDSGAPDDAAGTAA